MKSKKILTIDNNKDIYGISVFNVYNDGQIEPLYISSR